MAVKRSGVLSALAAVLAFGVGCQSGPPVAAEPSPTAPASTGSAPTPGGLPTRTPPPSTAASPTTPTPRTTPAPTAWRQGDSGPAVLALQRRLLEIGYWLGTADGRYGSSTKHAVTAFQKASGLARDGVAGPVTLAALARAARPRPRSASGRVIEIDLRRQLLLVVADGRVDWVMDTSTGSVPGTTPTGRFTVVRQIDGYDPGPLGVLYRPKYFVGGVAVHGYPSVPPYPASHGCVRVTNAAMDWLWASGRLPIGAHVWVY